MSVVLREALDADRPFVTHLEDVCMRDYAMALWGEWRPHPADDFVAGRHRIVVRDGVDSGCIESMFRVDHLWLGKLYLLPDQRRRGPGAVVLRAMIAEAARVGVPLRLSVLTTNLGALAFYRREGLRVRGQDRERIVLEIDPRLEEDRSNCQQSALLP